MEYERDVERYLVNEVKKKDGRCIKLHALSEEGLPDRMVLLPGGIIFFVELKRRKGILSPMQVAQHRSFKKLGQKVYTTFSKEEVDETLRGEVMPNEIQSTSISDALD